MERLVILFLIAAVCGIVALTALVISPSIALALSEVGFASGRLPHYGELTCAIAFVLLIATSRPGLLAVYSGAAGYNFKAAVLASFLWAVGGSVLWLASLYLIGGLGSIDRVYVTVFAGLLVLALIALSILIRGVALVRGQPLTIIPFVASLLVLLWAVGGGREFVNLFDLRQTPGALLQRVVEQPVVFLWSFVFSNLLASLALGKVARSRYASGAIHIVSLFLLIVLAHLLWIPMLFVLGHADLPRWVPIATGFVAFASIPAAFGALIFALPGKFATKVYERYVDPSSLSAQGVAAELVLPTTARSSSVVPNGKRAWIISFTGVSNEPRVLRQADALTASGWDVVVCGYDGHSKRPENWTFVRLPTSDAFASTGYRDLALIASACKALGAYGGGMFGWCARLTHELTPLWLHTRHELVRMTREHPELKADLVICHDYHTTDTGYAVAEAHGAKFSVDVHEYAAGQYFNDPKWVKWQRPVAVATQAYYLPKADVVSVVCKGIADLIARENRLRRSPIVIRSVPFPEFQEFRPVGQRIEVLYHGDLSVRRSIHTLIESVREWRPEFSLLLRGAGDPSYIADLKRQVSRCNLEKRVRFEPPVPFSQIVSAANKSDVGFFCFDGNSPQIRFTLPNKFFEYIMAGLCLCVGDTEEVGRLVREHNLGVLIRTHNPRAIAEAINGLSAERIEDYKRASLKAAQVLNWEAEKTLLLEAYEAVL